MSAAVPSEGRTDCDVLAVKLSAINFSEPNVLAFDLWMNVSRNDVINVRGSIQLVSRVRDLFNQG